MLKSTGTFEWVEKVPKDRKTVGSRTVFKTKRDGDGIVTKRKARIVAKGFSQVPGIDFTETFSSVAKFTTLRTLLSIVAHEDLEMKVPEEIREEGKEGWSWRLRKALYGLKQAGRQWKIKLDGILQGLGFERSMADDCLYILRENGDTGLIILVYIDDMAVAGKSLPKIEKFKKDIGEHVDITDLGEHFPESDGLHQPNA